MSERKIWFSEANRASLITIDKADILKRIDLLLHIIDDLDHPCCMGGLAAIEREINTNDFSQVDPNALKAVYTFRLIVHSDELILVWDEKADNTEFWNPPPGFVATPYGILASMFPDFMDWLTDFQVGSGIRDCYVLYSAEEFQRAVMQNSERLPAAPEVIEALPKMTVEEVVRGESGEAICMICLEKVPDAVAVTLLPCQHWFHSDEIEIWLRQRGTCPYCRSRVKFAKKD